jgi:hypothetical protein
MRAAAVTRKTRYIIAIAKDSAHICKHMHEVPMTCIAITRARVNPSHPRQQNNIAGQAKVKAGVEGVVRRDTPATCIYVYVIRYTSRAPRRARIELLKKLDGVPCVCVWLCTMCVWLALYHVCVWLCACVCACVCVCVCSCVRMFVCELERERERAPGERVCSVYVYAYVCVRARERERQRERE